MEDLNKKFNMSDGELFAFVDHNDLGADSFLCFVEGIQLLSAFDFTKHSLRISFLKIFYKSVIKWRRF